jgi:hypothetical protein
VRRTLEFPHLVRAAPRWLTSLRDSAGVLLAAAVADVAGLAIEGSRFGRALDLCLATVPWALAWFGVWLLTRGEPGAQRRPMHEIRRWSLRLLATMPYVAFYLDMSAGGRSWWRYEWWGPYLMLGLMLAVAPATFLYYDQLRRSAQRLPRPSLAFLASVTRWLVPPIMIASVAQWLLTVRYAEMVDVLHAFPKPVLPGGADAKFVWDVYAGGTDWTDLPVMIRMVATVALLWSATILLMFFLAFQSAVSTSMNRQG